MSAERACIRSPGTLQQLPSGGLDLIRRYSPAERVVVLFWGQTQSKHSRIFRLHVEVPAHASGGYLSHANYGERHCLWTWLKHAQEICQRSPHTWFPPPRLRHDWRNEHFPGAQASSEGGGGGNLGAPGSANATCPRVVGLILPDQRVRCPATGACSSIAAALVALLVLTDHELRSDSAWLWGWELCGAGSQEPIPRKCTSYY